MPAFPLSSTIPPGGFFFIDESNGVKVRIDGDSYEHLAEKVLKHRLSNGKAPGNPMQEIVDVVCGKYPHFCRENNPGIVPPTRNVPAGIAVRVAAWLGAFMRVPDKGVREDTSSKRADICYGCPHNTAIVGCGNCVDSINRLFFIYRRDRPLLYADKLGGCTVLGQHNGAACLARNLPANDPVDKTPPRCWRRNPALANPH
jgi:hypothetical protein